MIEDLIVSIFGSLIVSLVTGYFGKWALNKHSSIILQVYVLFLAACTFIATMILSVVLNADLAQRLQSISEVNTLRFYHNCINSFVLIVVIIAITSLVVICAEAFDRSERRDNKADLDRYKALKK